MSKVSVIFSHRVQSQVADANLGTKGLNALMGVLDGVRVTSVEAATRYTPVQSLPSGRRHWRRLHSEHGRIHCRCTLCFASHAARVYGAVGKERGAEQKGCACADADSNAVDADNIVGKLEASARATTNFHNMLRPGNTET